MTPKFEIFDSEDADRDSGLVWSLPDDWSQEIARNDYVEPSAAMRGFDWAKGVYAYTSSPDHWAADAYIQCQLHGLQTLNDTIEISPILRGGIPVLRGTRFTVSQLLAELANTCGPAEIAENFELDEEQIIAFLNGLALVTHKSYTK